MRGRDRLVAWDGGLHIHGNVITRAVPVNFWNPNRPLRRSGKNRLSWESITTGGVAGVILTLQDAHRGTLEIDTLQRRVHCALGDVGLRPKSWQCGGVAKKIEVYRLPNRAGANRFSFRVPLSRLRSGDNPLYLRVMQEDGHMAWTSPVYLHKKTRRKK